MFDKRLTQLCPESKKYIVGNIILQWLELALNTFMIITVAETISKLYYKEWTMSDLTLPIIVILTTLVIRFFTAQGATRMSYLASKTVKQKLRELIYGKLLKLGSKYPSGCIFADTDKKITALKENFKRCQQLYDVYSDIAATYREISQGDYISKLVAEEQKKRENRKNTETL